MARRLHAAATVILAGAASIHALAQGEQAPPVAAPEAPPGAAADEAPARPAPATLRIGDAAPTLAKAKWLQGDPAPEWQKGQIYVLDFWATWCSPCIASIPHMNDVHKTLGPKGVNVIGVAVWPSPDMTPTAEFVKEQGDAMAYRICEDVDDALNQSFMQAVRAQGIPTVMIINREGLLAWVGHPQGGMDEALSQIISGEYDLKSAAERATKQAALEEKAGPLIMEANALAGEGKWKEALDKIEEVINLGFNAPALALTKAQVMMVELQDADAAYAYLDAAIGTHLKDDYMALNEVAWFIVDAPIQRKDLDIAMKAATRAEEVSGGKNAVVLDTLARVHFMKGDAAKALEVQERAVALADARTRPQMESALREYKEAAGGAGAEPAKE